MKKKKNKSREFFQNVMRNMQVVVAAHLGRQSLVKGWEFCN